MKKLLAPALIALLGCSAIKLTAAGEGVVVGPPPNAECRALGLVQADEGRNFQSAAANVEAVRVGLRNQAAELGGDYLTIQPAEPGGAVPTRGDPGCPNCIAMTAAVYRCARPAAPMASAPVAVTGPQLSRVAATAALDAAAESAAACRAQAGPAGRLAVKVTFAATGDVVFAEVQGPPFADTPRGECVARKFLRAHLPPFAGPAVSLVKEVTIGP